MSLDPRTFLPSRRRAEEAASPVPVPLGGTRAQRIQRLQIGLMGIGGMVLLLGLADAISSRAQLTEDNAVPEAAPTVEVSETAAPSDPLADAGVIPDLPATPAPEGASPTGGGGAPAAAPGNAPQQ